MDFTKFYSSGQHYADFLAQHASPGDLRNWTKCYASSELTAEQLQTLEGFERQMKVLCIAGAWCPDCAIQCPGMQRFAEANPLVDLRFVDRELFSASGGELMLCGGQRVPTVVFLSEDDYFCGVYGDRSLTRYRQLAGQDVESKGGLTMQQQIVQEWLQEFERIQLMLKTSPRLQMNARL